MLMTSGTDRTRRKDLSQDLVEQTLGVTGGNAPVPTTDHTACHCHGRGEVCIGNELRNGPADPNVLTPADLRRLETLGGEG